jgi:hypothetical protein
VRTPTKSCKDEYHVGLREIIDELHDEQIGLSEGCVSGVR